MSIRSRGERLAPGIESAGWLFLRPPIRLGCGVSGFGFSYIVVPYCGPVPSLKGSEVWAPGFVRVYTVEGLPR